MLPFPAPKQLILACHLTGIYDVNRNTTLPDDDYAIIQKWAASVADVGLHGVVFHNNLSEATCAQHQSGAISFVRIAYDGTLNPNVYRYSVYRDFLNAHAGFVDSLFVTDVADVVVVCNPFVQPLFEAHPDALFCGDEPKRLNNDWMKAHAAHLRSNISDYADYEARFAAHTLLNCGVIGGRIAVMQPFLEQLAGLHERYNFNNKTAYTGDMGAFNYLARTQFNAHLIHGAPVNTVFKAYEEARSDCWFRHK